MRDHALVDRALGGRNLPLVGGRLHEHGARRRAALAHRVLRIADAAAAGGGEIAPHALAGDVLAGRRIFRLDLGPVGVEFFGDELGEAGDRALAHLLTADAHDDRVVGTNDDPCVHFRRDALSGRLAERQVEAEGEAARGGAGADEEIAAGKIDVVHVAPLSRASSQEAACLMAVLMRL